MSGRTAPRTQRADSAPVRGDAVASGIAANGHSPHEPHQQIPFVDLGAYHTSIHGELMERLERVVTSNAFVLGAEVGDFEQRFADYCGSQYAIGVGSGTDALMLALRALPLQSGDEVITAANTFIATVEAIALAGGAPVLVDADPRTYGTDVARISRAITPRTKAIVPVHMYGHPIEMEPIHELAAAHGLYVVEDAAQAHGARYRGLRAGSLGSVGCFSFYPAKNLGAMGDGGAIVTDDDGIAERARQLRNHGGVLKYEHRRLGTNSRLDSMQAAVLNVKLEHLDERNERRRRIAAEYERAFAAAPAVIVPCTIEGAEHVFHLYVVRVHADNRDGLLRHLQSRGIATGIHYPTPVHRLEAFEHLGYELGAFPVAEQLSREIVSLPMHSEMSTRQVERVAAETMRYLQGAPVAAVVAP